jgi:molecular chaperone GrpE (heat shock protein)
MQAAGLKDKLLRSHAEMTNLADRHRKEKENLQNYAVQVRTTLLGHTLPAMTTGNHALGDIVPVDVIPRPWC